MPLWYCSMVSCFNSVLTNSQYVFCPFIFFIARTKILPGKKIPTRQYLHSRAILLQALSLTHTITKGKTLILTNNPNQYPIPYANPNTNLYR